VTDPSPPPLTVAASVVAVQGAVLVLLAVLELADISADRRSLGLSTAAFFGAYGALLLGAGWALRRRTAWARGPVLLTQLIALGLAWNLRDSAAIAIVLAVSAVVALGGLVHPDSIAALSGTPRDDSEDSGPGSA
jgi:hypothetical protein